VASSVDIVAVVLVFVPQHAGHPMTSDVETFNASVLYHNGYTLHTTVHGREVNYQLTHPDGHQDSIQGMLTRDLLDLQPKVFVPASLCERFGGALVVDVTLVAWAFAEGVLA
jgi:hypothetical protein